MAKRRTKKSSNRRRSSRRRSSLSGLKGGSQLSMVPAVLAGAVIAGFVNKVIPATVNDKIVAGGKIALGVALPNFVPGNLKNMAQAAGFGMIAVGGVDLLKSFGVLSGDFDIPVINGDVLTGDDLEIINGIEDGEAIEVNGDEDQFGAAADSEDE